MVDWVLALLREERALNEAGLGAATAKCTVVRRVVILKKVWVPKNEFFAIRAEAAQGVSGKHLPVSVYANFAGRKPTPDA